LEQGLVVLLLRHLLLLPVLPRHLLLLPMHLLHPLHLLPMVMLLHCKLIAAVQACLWSGQAGPT
jgi:hypothetical protein